ncbi:MAG: hypothetical protein ACI4XF_03070 [Oscillospiraceae bacterium]
MSKSVLISIKPKWCELIANGKKTVEVRKSRPKLETPFKVYIYCTLQGSNEFFKNTLNGNISEWNKENWGLKKGKVIGEFVCDTMITDRTFGHDPLFNALSCMTIEEITSYCTERKMYGWHISDLVIYDKPRELNEFGRYGQLPCEKACPYEKCEHFKYMRVNANEYDYDCDCNGLLDNFMPLTRPPQSWCYVEEDTDIYKSEDIEVTGNIFDNPELLEGGEGE